jgi:hypothetical protein
MFVLTSSDAVKKGKNCFYFLALSISYSASTGAIVFVDIERRTSVVSLRQ